MPSETSCVVVMNCAIYIYIYNSFLPAQAYISVCDEHSADQQLLMRHKC